MRAAGADHELADAVSGVGALVGVLRREAFIVVIVAVQDHVGVGRLQQLP